jgi:hypothetical protein
MSPRNHPIKTTLALALALGAITPGATEARMAADAGAPAPGPVQDLRAQAKTSSLAGTPARARQVVTASAAHGFDWGEATIGAAGILGFSIVAVGGSLAIAGKRRHAIAREDM